MPLDTTNVSGDESVISTVHFSEIVAGTYFAPGNR